MYASNLDLFAAEHGTNSDRNAGMCDVSHWLGRMGPVEHPTAAAI